MSVLQSLLFSAHALAALFLGFARKSLVVEAFAEVLSTLPAGYPNYNPAVQAPNNTTGCFFEVCQSYEAVQKGLEWNVFALLTAFEWASAGFALGYMGFGWGWCSLWNVFGCALILYFYNALSLWQVYVTVLSLLVSSTASWFVPDGVVRQYTEYCVTTSLLFLSVLLIFVPSAPSWAGILGGTSVVLCNLCGVGAYLSFVQHTEHWEASQLDTGGEFDLMRVRNHMKLFLMNAWFTLCMGLLIVVYLARDYLQGGSMLPWWTQILFYSLLAGLVLSCAWAVLCYTMVDRERVGSGLAILDAAAKFVVVCYVCVFY